MHKPHRTLSVSLLCLAAACGSEKALPATETLLVTFSYNTLVITIDGERIAPDQRFQKLYPKGARVRYTVAPVDTAQVVTVAVDTIGEPPSGEIVMDRTHWILAVAKPRPQRPEITFENRALYDINRQIIAVATPDAKLFQAMADELGCLVDWYGDERGRQLASDADRIAYAESGDPAARERVGRAFAGVSIDARECTKQKPR